jgi:LytR cell envelope-related transcriptional attenuator
LHTSAPSPSLDALVRPWRTATVVVSLVAAAELVVLVVAGIALLGKPLARHVRAAANEEVLGAPKAKPDRSAPTLPRARTRVVVLNGNGVSGAAGATADRVRSRKYRIASVGNASRTDYATSIVMYRPGRRPEAERLARDLRVDVVAPLDGIRLKKLRKAHAVLIVGR